MSYLNNFLVTIYLIIGCAIVCASQLSKNSSLHKQQKLVVNNVVNHRHKRDILFALNHNKSSFNRTLAVE
jgi:hypothetical protein